VTTLLLASFQRIFLRRRNQAFHSLPLVLADLLNLLSFLFGRELRVGADRFHFPARLLGNRVPLLHRRS